MLAGAVKIDVPVANFAEAGAEARKDDFRGVAVRAQVAQHNTTERGVGDFPDQFGDLCVR